MVRIRLLWRVICVLLLSTLLCACSGASRVSDYRQSGFRGEIAWQSGGISLTGVAEISAPVSGEAREIILTVTSPSSLAGVVLRGRAGSTENLCVVCGELVLESAAMGRLWDITTLLLPVGRFEGICEVEKESLVYAEIVQAKEEGAREVYEVYAEAPSGAPRRIRCGDREVEFLSFAVTE